MCGRFTVQASQEEMVLHFSVRGILYDHRSANNVTPTNEVSAVSALERSDQRILEKFYWGLVPSWSRDMLKAPRMINARCETVFEKNAFRAAIKSRRCLIPATGFYEWNRLTRQPYCFSMKSSQLFALAGLYEEWTAPDGSPLRSCTILTTEANDLVRPVHERMPVLIRKSGYGIWLDKHVHSERDLKPFFQPWSQADMDCLAIDKSVVTRQRVLTPKTGTLDL